MLFNGKLCYTRWSHPNPKQLIFMTREVFLKCLKVRVPSLTQYKSEKLTLLCLVCSTKEVLNSQGESKQHRQEYCWIDKDTKGGRNQNKMMFPMTFLQQYCPSIHSL